MGTMKSGSDKERKKRLIFIRSLISAGDFKIDGLPLVDHADFESFISNVEKNARSCYLCDKKADGIAIFFPKDSKAFWGNDKKQRTIFYGLCSTCQTKPGSEEEVEFKMKMSL